MQGLIRLKRLPKEIQEKIVAEYGTVERLYQKVFDLNSEEYRLTGTKNPRIGEIHSELYNIEAKLEEFGINDGSIFITEIASDFGEIIVTRKINDLNKYLAQFGTDFETMQKWLKDNYGI